MGKRLTVSWVVVGRDEEMDDESVCVVSGVLYFLSVLCLLEQYDIWGVFGKSTPMHDLDA